MNRRFQAFFLAMCALIAALEARDAALLLAGGPESAPESAPTRAASVELGSEFALAAAPREERSALERDH
jgi:hypothetical protein